MKDVKKTSEDVEKTRAVDTRDLLLEVATDLTASLSTEDRYRRLLNALKMVVPCDAAALLRHSDGALVPVAIDGLSSATLGHTFDPQEHPRLAKIISSKEPVRFADDEPLPDPYDGLVAGGFQAEWSHVHSCMGSALYVGDDLVGVLTVDALEQGAFDDVDDRYLAIFAALAAAAMRTAGLIESLEELAKRRGEMAQTLVLEALKRQGGEILGQSEQIANLRKELVVVAESDLTVLVTGETGTGKELVARTLHARSSRSTGTLAYVNCAALPESIAESELFGHIKGSFTGAVADRAGKFELADGGTLFLDEIGELPLSLQPKLLRALQSGEIQRVGSDDYMTVDVRIIAATNRNLSDEVKAGRFRADLYHRFSVYPVHVPPLVDREGDIPLLAGHFLDRARVKLGLGQVRLTEAALVKLESYSWPGNVRELEHLIMRGALRAAGGRRGEDVFVDANHVDVGGAVGVQNSRPKTVAAESKEIEVRSLSEAVLAFKKDMVKRTIDASGGNWAEAARRLKIDRGNLHRLAERLGLK